ncbi:hypothetical protein V493_00455 [Pseudogymnoascus sp. VKM F-4281 (FW-2241)]|nr:hypothetical protein V493_00455 [Pseudogymnoascus sp. VKM F-4281 (FW-2241)]
MLDVGLVAMTELVEIFDDIGLTQYLHSFLEQGFDTWDTVLDITEPDFDILGVKLGHRRRLQRKIAEARGISHGHPALASPKKITCSLYDKLSGGGKGVTAQSSDGKDCSSSLQLSGKRKYTKHPRPDENAPTRPRSAYVIFSNKMREKLKDKSLSFTQFTKLIGKKWQNLTTSEKEPYEQQAFNAKENYSIELAEYRQTERYEAYSKYLQGFYAKPKKSSWEEPNETVKVRKLDNMPNASSSSTTENSTSSSISHGASYGRRTQGPSAGLIQRPWISSEHTVQAELAPKSHAQAHVGGPSGKLMGYCDTVIRGNSQTLACLDRVRPTDIPVTGYSREELVCENCGITNRQSIEESPPELSANMTFGVPSRNLADTNTTSATVSTPALEVHDGFGGSQRPYSAYHVESSGYPVYLSGIEESIERGSAEALNVAYATSNRSRGFGSSMTIPVQISSLDTNLATNAEAQISHNSAVRESIMDKSRPGEGWTEVTDDVLLIRHLIDLYFCWEHPITSSLMKEPFLKDFSQGKRRHCSSLLINAMSALACRLSDRPAIRADPNKIDTIGDHFFMEAKRLLQHEMPPCLTTIQALGLMSIREAGCGRESTGYFYSCQSIRMAIELGLHQQVDNIGLVFSSDESEVRSVTFWAAFVLDSTWSLLVGRVPQISRKAVSEAKPASIEEKEDEDWVPYTDAGIQVDRTYTQKRAPLLFDEAFASGAVSDQSKESQLRLDGFGIIDQQTMKAPLHVDKRDDYLSATVVQSRDLGSFQSSGQREMELWAALWGTMATILKRLDADDQMFEDHVRNIDNGEFLRNPIH